jgi:bifunctional non-homologous end joining protein LigD
MERTRRLIAPPLPQNLGQQGLHVFVPIERTLRFEQARSACELIGRAVMAQHSDVVTSDRNVAKRAGKLFFDHTLNVRGRTLTAACSPRAVAGAPIPMPLSRENPTDSILRISQLKTLKRSLAERGEVRSDIQVADSCAG